MGRPSRKRFGRLTKTDEGKHRVQKLHRTRRIARFAPAHHFQSKCALQNAAVQRAKVGRRCADGLFGAAVGCIEHMSPRTPRSLPLAPTSRVVLIRVVATPSESARGYAQQGLNWKRNAT